MEIIQKVIHKLQKLYYTSSSDRLLAYYRQGETVRELGLARNSQYFTN
jgi:hypothetical protein